MLQNFFKGTGINPFHFHTHPQSRELPHRIVLPDIGMVQAASDFILLAKHFIVERIVPVLQAYCLEHRFTPSSGTLIELEWTVLIPVHEGNFRLE